MDVTWITAVFVLADALMVRLGALRSLFGPSSRCRSRDHRLGSRPLFRQSPRTRSSDSSRATILVWEAQHLRWGLLPTSSGMQMNLLECGC